MKLNENRIEIRTLDEHFIDYVMLHDDVEIVGFVCAGCGRHNCGKLTKSRSGKEHETLSCNYVVIIDGEHYRPLCDECYASFQTPRSTASKLFGL